jgi:hypothetical protein
LSEYEDIGEMMPSLARQAVEIGREYGLELDYSRESIERLERLLAQLGAEMSAARPSDEEISMVSKLWGAYWGESLRRIVGGEWQLERAPGTQHPTAALNVRGSSVFPTVKIYRRLTLGSGENVDQFFGFVVERLRKSVQPV